MFNRGYTTACFQLGGTQSSARLLFTIDQMYGTIVSKTSIKRLGITSFVDEVTLNIPMISVISKIDINLQALKKSKGAATTPKYNFIGAFPFLMSTFLS